MPDAREGPLLKENGCFNRYEQMGMRQSGLGAGCEKARGRAQQKP